MTGQSDSVRLNPASPSAKTAKVVHLVREVDAWWSVCSVQQPYATTLDPAHATCRKCLHRHALYAK